MATNTIRRRLFICGAGELDEYRWWRLTHAVFVNNPGAASSRPSWFDSAHLQLWFGDVISEADARQYHTRAPTLEDVRQGLEFFRRAWLVEGSRVLVSCDYGASRSPALAYVFVADQRGGGRETEALKMILAIRPNAVPNDLVVRLGDAVLGRQGALHRALKQLYSTIDSDLSAWLSRKPGSL